jgi:L-arabinokinase
MYQVIQSNRQLSQDAENFIEIMNSLDHHPINAARALFAGDQEIVVSRAPGRLDVMGGIADYSGSLVLQLPIREATFAAVQLRPDRLLKVVSLSGEDPNRTNFFNMSLNDFTADKKCIDYQFAQQYFQKDRSTHWAAYVAGEFLVLMREKGISFQQGANILIHSQVPEGKGVSSSAALEVASLNAIIKTFKISLQPRETALLCQKVENSVVGAPCGIMDQMTAVFGKTNQFLSLLCQPAEIRAFIEIPEEISFWGMDSGIKHSISGVNYTRVRIGTFMGQRIIATKMAKYFPPGHYLRDSTYLADITPSIYEQYFSEYIPVRMKGQTFIKKYQQTNDKITRVDPEETYLINKPTLHPIYEHFRVGIFARLLQKPLTDSSLKELGELMYQSHASYSACGLGSAETDRLVELTRDAGVEAGIFGAKITGGGSGGTVVILGKQEAYPVIQEIACKYSSETGHKPYIFSGSSMGVEEFGHLILKNKK